MTNEPRYRDLAKLVPYIFPFNDAVVVRIDRLSMTSAAVVGLLAILYFSLAPAASSTVLEVSSVLLSGYNCKMIAAVTREIQLFQVVPDKVLDDFQAEFVIASKSLAVTAQTPSSIPIILGKSFLAYDNARFDTYEACLATAKADTTCKWLPSTYKQTSAPSPVYSSCVTKPSCSVFGGKIVLSQNGFEVNQTLLANPAYGKCSNQANIPTCSNINENCNGLGEFLAIYHERIRNAVLTPEVICKPYLDYPPYLCTKSQAMNVPSILSQSLAFATSTIAVVKAFSFMVVKMLPNVEVVAPSNVEPSTTP